MAESPLGRSRSTSQAADGRSIRARGRARLVAGGLARMVVLAAIVVGSGAIAGLAIGYPLRNIDFGGSDAAVLDQEALSGTIDAERALITGADLPKSYVQGEPSLDAAVNLIGAEYCGVTVTPSDQVGERLARTFVDSQNNSLIFSEVMRVRRQNDAGKYVREMVALFDGCDNNRYFRVDDQGVRNEVRISNDRKDPPLAADYLNRTLTPLKGGTIQQVSYFQVGNVIVALQYAGPANPPKTLMSEAELEILYRVAPDQISKTAVIDGLKPLPDDVSSTTVPDLVEPSPTSSPDIVAPPVTEAPDPTFTTPTTKKSR